MNIKSAFISALTLSLLLITQTAHADFRKALDAYIARDGTTMLKEVKDAVEKKNDDGLMLFLNAIFIDAITSRQNSLRTNSLEISASKNLSTFETILSATQQQEVEKLLYSASQNSTGATQYRLYQLPYLFQRSSSANQRQMLIETAADKGSFWAARDMVEYFTHLNTSSEAVGKARFWYIKAAELGDLEFVTGLAMRYLHYSTDPRFTYAFMSHEQCVAGDDHTICFEKDETRGFEWLKQAVKINAQYPQYLRRFSYEMGNIMMTKFDTRAPDIKQAYLWYLLGINSPNTGGFGRDDKYFLDALTNMHKTGDLKKASPKLDSVWGDEKKRDVILYPKELSELPLLLKEAMKPNVKTAPVFTYQQNFPQSYALKIFASGQVFLKLNSAWLDGNEDKYMQVSPTKVQQFIKKVEILGINNWALNQPDIANEQLTCESSFASNGKCTTQDFIITLNLNGKQRIIYIGNAIKTKKEALIDAGQTERMRRAGQIFALVEEYFPTQMLRCRLSNSKAYSQECIQNDQKLIKLIN